MRKRIFSGWTWTRWVFVIIGLLMVIHAGLDGEWAFTLPGLYFAGMGVFGLGCASGSCANNACEVKPDHDHRTS
ncbi:hypothetical protein LZ575_11205 [Antarcticibacterium sp. 1MA-6-2]|uniref:hypothetical protein n=1 Tax=Antarcticibacterium sp. 1MA-6-2 TaxID=2908210 RepID=UPI001F3FF2A1|nr:hypothetical protein [Antarcticibacterium sp. 1MA-6-2]UJH89654.1 hypothetical protein LZ575_11205 [Antarcticibacterium sp. 1MA-6-2]